MGSVTIDFVARTDDPDVWRLVFVEEGPWEDIIAELQRVQDRLYDCIDAVMDGQLAARFPDTQGKTIIIRLDGYNLAESSIRDFWSAFSQGVMEIPDYAHALKESPHVKNFLFELNLDVIESGA